MQYQIFLPGVAGANPQFLVDVGLADLVAGANFCDSAHGPIPPGGGVPGPGVVVAWPRPGAAQLGYRPEAQTWLPAVKCGDLAAGRYWVGFWNDSPPTPADLQRPYRQAGIRVALGDGNEWLLPMAKELDHNMVLADDGTWKFEIQRRFHDFYLEHLRWFQFFGTMTQSEGASFAEAAEFILMALRINYRLTGEVASQLRLFTKENVLSAMFAVLGTAPPAVSGGAA